MSDITVRFIDKDGVETSVCASPGQTLMEVAVTNGVDGIIGLCGGMMSCGTCVCRIDDAAAHGFDNPGMEEAELLDSLEAGGDVSDGRPSQIAGAARAQGRSASTAARYSPQYR
jgi:2Fe-2S ferredoxin